MAVDTSKRNERQYKWQVENRERINVLLNKGTKERIEIAVRELNKRMNVSSRDGLKASEFIRQAIQEKLDHVNESFGGNLFDCVDVQTDSGNTACNDAE